MKMLLRILEMIISLPIFRFRGNKKNVRDGKPPKDIYPLW